MKPAGKSAAGVKPPIAPAGFDPFAAADPFAPDPFAADPFAAEAEIKMLPEEPVTPPDEEQPRRSIFGTLVRGMLFITASLLAGGGVLAYLHWDRVQEEIAKYRPSLCKWRPPRKRRPPAARTKAILICCWIRFPAPGRRLRPIPQSRTLR